MLAGGDWARRAGMSRFPSFLSDRRRRRFSFRRVRSQRLLVGGWRKLTWWARRADPPRLAPQSAKRSDSLFHEERPCGCPGEKLLVAKHLRLPRLQGPAARPLPEHATDYEGRRGPKRIGSPSHLKS